MPIFHSPKTHEPTLVNRLTFIHVFLNSLRSIESVLV
nr:MAG TPA: hypothetical protein [Caudoviricetes sp.]